MVKEKILLFWIIVLALLSGQYLLKFVYPIYEVGEVYWWILNITKLLLVLLLAYLLPSVIIGFCDNAAKGRPEIREKVERQVQYLASGRYKKFLVLVWILIIAAGFIAILGDALKWTIWQTIFAFFVSPTLTFGALMARLGKLKGLMNNT